jgi:hypothetical protein
MLSLATRKLSGFCFSFALAALLLNCASASAAGATDDAHDQAAALLSRSAVSIAPGAIALNPADASAASVDPMDQAGRLLSGASASPLVDNGQRADATSPAPSDTVAAYANAEESARRMLLGSGA